MSTFTSYPPNLETLREWVFFAYPDDKETVKALPEAILSSMYTDVALFGPSLGKVHEVKELFDRVFLSAEVTPGLNSQIGFVLSSMVGFSQSGTPRVAEMLRKYRPSLVHHQGDFVKNLRFSCGNPYTSEVLELIEFLSSAWTVKDFGIGYERSLKMADEAVKAWSEMRLLLEESLQLSR